jgi:hypothetical protein
MSHRSSSTSSSKARGTTRRKQSCVVLLWTFAFLALFDVAVNLAFPYPDPSSARTPTALQQYFDYGRSAEAKVRRIVGETDDTTLPIGLAGWLDPESWKGIPTQPEHDDGVLVAIYGMSFAFHIGEALQEFEPRVTLRRIGGPGAPPNHSYCAYTIDRDSHEAPVVMLGILASSIRFMPTVTGATGFFERPYPYTYPTYAVREDGLRAIWPPVRSLEDLRVAVREPAQWDVFETFLKAHDAYYSPLLFKENWSDRSATLRMLRRAWFQHNNLAFLNSIHGSEGFDEDADFVPVLRAIVTNFADTARGDGALPVIALIQDSGYDDHLYRLLHETLDANDIPYISTHAICPATDRANFVSDGHFTHEANQELGKALQQLIESHGRLPAGWQGTSGEQSS